MTEPTDDEIVALAMNEHIKVRTGAGAVRLARAVLAKFGTPPAVAGEPVALLVRKNSWRDGQWEAAPPNSPTYGLAWANQRVYVYTTPQPTQSQAGAVPLTRQQLREAFYSETACTLGGDVDFAEKVCRVVEKAHGIKGGQI